MFNDIGQDELTRLAAEAPGMVLLYKSAITRDRHYVTALEACEMVKSGDVSEIWLPKEQPTPKSIYKWLKAQMLYGGRCPLSSVEVQLLAQYVQKHGIPHKSLGKIVKIWTGDTEAILGVLEDEIGSKEYIVQDQKTGHFGIHRTSHSDKDVVGEVLSSGQQKIMASFRLPQGGF